MALEPIQIFSKDPDAKLDYGFDWSPWLESGETISTSAWTVPTGLTDSDESYDGDSTKIWLSGGTVDEDYIVANKIITSDGRIDERSFKVMVRQR
jgi:hypothetical protein